MRRPSLKTLATLALALGVSVLAATPSFSGSSTGLSVSGYQVVGSSVLVQVSNSASTTHSGYVEVKVLLLGLVPARTTQSVTVSPNGTVGVSLGFLGLVSQVSALSVVDNGSPF